MQKQLFRQYDIRGKIGTEFVVQDFYNLAHAIIVFLKTLGPCPSVIIGMDGRVHSQAIFNQIAQACKDAGVDIFFIGVCSTPITLFSSYYLGVDAVLMITASHNPAEYNGLKIYYHHQAIEGRKLQTIYELYIQGIRNKNCVPGVMYQADYLVDTYIDYLVEEFKDLKNFRQPCFIDCGNGVGGPILQKLMMAMHWNHITLLYEQVDGTYPNHIADPTDIENVQELLQQVQVSQGSFGIGLDGDCDRVAVITKTKGLVPADQLLTLFAGFMQADKVVADIKSSSIVASYGAQVILAPTGCAQIIEMMQKHNVMIGGELSGHFFFADRHHGYDDGIYAMLRFFEILHEQNIDCDTLLASLPESFATKDIRIPCLDEEKFIIVEAIKKELVAQDRYRLILIDGVRFENEDGWCLIRASNTQPMLSVCCQAVSAEKLKMMKKILIDVLQDYIELQLLYRYIV